MVNHKSWSNLDTSTHKTLGNVAKKLFDYGFSHKEVLAKDSNGNYVMTDKELKQNFDLKGRGYSRSKTFRRQVKQITFDIDRKQNTRTEIIHKFVQFTGGKYTKTTNRLVTDFSKKIGLNTFFDISNIVRKTYNISKKKSYAKTRQIIQQYNLDKSKLTKKDTQILQYFY